MTQLMYLYGLDWNEFSYNTNNLSAKFQVELLLLIPNTKASHTLLALAFQL